MNSVMEGLSSGVPLVVIPQMLEQRITAQRVQELGLGIALDSTTVTVDRLQEAVERVASEPQFRTRVQHMREIIRESGGARRAAEAIIHFTHTIGQKGWSWAPLPEHE
jgi:MGT family glycosyltransferase